jgi:hypothetical protein
MASLQEKRGAARRVTRRSLVLHASLRRRGALRRAVGVLLRRRAALSGGRLREAARRFAGFAVISDGLSGKVAGAPQRPHRQPAPGGRPVLATRRSPDAARVRGLLAAPAGAGPSTRAGATGSRPSWERTSVGILSYRNIVKRRNVEKDGARVQERCAGSKQPGRQSGRKNLRALYKARFPSCPMSQR